MFSLKKEAKGIVLDSKLWQIFSLKRATKGLTLDSKFRQVCSIKSHSVVIQLLTGEHLKQIKYITETKDYKLTEFKLYCESY